jgi:hypothetical protein
MSWDELVEIIRTTGPSERTIGVFDYRAHRLPLKCNDSDLEAALLLLSVVLNRRAELTQIDQLVG